MISDFARGPWAHAWVVSPLPPGRLKFVSLLLLTTRAATANLFFFVGLPEPPLEAAAERPWPACAEPTERGEHDPTHEPTARARSHLTGEVTAQTLSFRLLAGEVGGVVGVAAAVVFRDLRERANGRVRVTVPFSTRRAAMLVGAAPFSTQASTADCTVN